MRRVAILTPMENPTVEAEMRRLLPADLDYVVARLVSAEADPALRLVDYARHAHATVARFGAMPLAAIGFACTGSSYLLDDGEAEAIARGFDRPFLFTAVAAEAIMRERGVSRLAIISPYPAALHQVALDWFRRRGFTIVSDDRVPIGGTDTRAIYRLTGNEAAGLIEMARSAKPDAILLSGTGMPTLPLIAPDGDPPVLSSNYCLARALEAAA